jgi:hypothetical protein
MERARQFIAKMRSTMAALKAVELATPLVPPKKVTFDQRDEQARMLELLEKLALRVEGMDGKLDEAIGDRGIPSSSAS